MRKLVRILAALAFATTAVLAGPWQAHFDARLAIISAQVELLGTGDMMVLGDSNTEMFWWNTNAGCQIINAGFAGARTADIAAVANNLAATTLPKVVHIMLGTNDVYLLTTDPEWPALYANLTAVVTAFKSRGAKVVLWPIPPMSSAYLDPYGGNAKRDAINAVIAQVAVDQGVYWDWWWPQQITSGGGSSGYAVSGALQSDGVHLSAASQISRYYRMETWKSYIQSQTGVTCS